MNKETVGISGITCAACAKRIEKAVGRLEGISGASVNFAAEKLTVEYDVKKIAMDKIRETVEKQLRTHSG